MREGTVVQFSNGRIGRLLPNGDWEISGLSGDRLDVMVRDDIETVLWVPAKDVSEYALGTVLLVDDGDGATYPIVKDGHTEPGGGWWAGPYGKSMIDCQVAEMNYTMIYGGKR